MSAAPRYTAANVADIFDRKADDRDRSYFATFTVFLGGCGNFDHWGNPDTGRVCYIGAPGCSSGSFGDRFYWRAHVARYAGSEDERFTKEGRNW